MSEMPFTAASFEKFCNEKKVMATRCKTCGALHLPPRPLCTKCKGQDLDWKQLSGKGKIVAFTVIGVGPWTMTKEGYDKDHPYCSGIVELDEGPRMSAQILGVDVQKPDQIKIGTRVHADFMERGSFSLVPEVANVRRTYLVFRASQ